MHQSEDEFLRHMAHRYVWDMTGAEALKTPERIVRRVMDFGVLEDVLALESVLGCARLAAILRASPPGTLRPRSWWFWHFRLGLTKPADDPPPMPVRSFG